MKIIEKLAILAAFGSATKIPNQNNLYFKRGFQQMMFQRGFQQMIGNSGTSDYSDISSLFYWYFWTSHDYCNKLFEKL